MARRTTCLAAFLFVILGTAAFGATAQRSYVAGRFALELEGQPATFVDAIAGGFASGNVVEEPESPDYFVKKHLDDPPGYADISIECGAGVSPEFWNWIRSTLEGNISTRMNGSLLALDFNYNVVRRLNFSNAQITRITFPRVDAASKEPAKLKITLTPASTYTAPKGGPYKGTVGSKQKNWLAANFRLSIPGLDTTKVNAVEAIDVAIPLTAPPDQSCVICTPVIPKINFPALQFVGAETSSATWFAWHETFVIGGQHNDADEKTGRLEYLDSSRTTTLFTLNFTGLGIVSVMNEPNAGEAISRVRATTYAEKMTISGGPAMP